MFFSSDFFLNIISPLSHQNMYTNKQRCDKCCTRTHTCLLKIMTGATSIALQAYITLNKPQGPSEDLNLHARVVLGRKKSPRLIPCLFLYQAQTPPSVQRHDHVASPSGLRTSASEPLLCQGCTIPPQAGFLDR